MSSTDIRGAETTREVSVGRADLKFEAVVIPVSDVGRSKSFYAELGWRLDADFGFDNGFRVVQFTPPGSGCSVQFGANITSAAPGSAKGLYLIVSDIEAARDELVAVGGLEVSEVFPPGGHRALSSSPTARMAGWQDGHQKMRAMAPLPTSPTRTEMAGCCRRSRHGCPAASTPMRHRSHR